MNIKYLFKMYLDRWKRNY